ncbi:helix-turn-helix domain-containing protein [Gracilibacillus massiliensis]|nr:HTH domain-containing protein [Gracilibacillus massiliensis]
MAEKLEISRSTVHRYLKIIPRICLSG